MLCLMSYYYSVLCTVLHFGTYSMFTFYFYYQVQSIYVYKLFPAYDIDIWLIHSNGTPL